MKTAALLLGMGIGIAGVQLAGRKRKLAPVNVHIPSLNPVDMKKWLAANPSVLAAISRSMHNRRG